MSARLLGSIDIIGGMLLLLSRPYFGDYSTIVVVIGLLLLGKGLFSMV